MPYGADGYHMPEGTDGYHMPEATDGYHMPDGTDGYHMPDGTDGYHMPEGTDGYHMPDGTDGYMGDPFTEPYYYDMTVEEFCGTCDDEYYWEGCWEWLADCQGSFHCEQEFGYECEKGLGECLLSSVSDAYNYCSDASHMTYDMTVDEYCDWECDAEDDLCLGWLADCPGFYHCE